MTSYDLWQFLFGVALFIMGMRFLEDALHSLAGRSFKLYLRRNANNSLRAIFGGTFVTMLLQSSSIVNLLVLAFVGAGIIGQQNGLALILGANLGTTATSWLIAVFGFEMNIEMLAWPMVGIAGILYYGLNRQSVWARWCLVLLGLGLLFAGLGFIKTGMTGLVSHFNLQAWAGSSPVWFLLIGFGLTTLIQSSSATMAITMSVLATGALKLTDGMAIALGSEVGTTMKVVLAAYGGGANKKRVALGNFLFNLITTLLFIFLLTPIAGLISNVLQISQPTIAIVVFQTFVNLAGILLFFPFLPQLGHLLEKLFSKAEKKSLFLPSLAFADALLAQEALRKEVTALVHHILIFCRSAYGHHPQDNHT